MKVLIVNGNPETPNGHKRFLGFRYLVQKMFKEDKDQLDGDVEFIIRDRESIVDFLYEIQSSFGNARALKSFETFDMIFIAGCGTVLPWAASMQNILVLLRMCLKLKKYVFACSSIMQALVFVSASNFDRTVNLVNPTGEPHVKGTLKCESLPAKDQKYLIDRRTGDLYAYHSESDSWIPRANAGLHNAKAAQEYHRLGKYILKAPIYRPKQSIDGQDIFISKNTEFLVYIKNEHINHYAFAGVEHHKFLASTESKWDVHSFAFTSSYRTFRVLAESDKGPVAIEYGSHILAVLFDIDQKYSETLATLKNFIKSATEKVYQGQTLFNDVKMKKRMAESRVAHRQVNINYLLASAETPKSFKKATEQRDFRHSGFAVNKKNLRRIIYQSNQIQNNELHLNDKRLERGFHTEASLHVRVSDEREVHQVSSVRGDRFDRVERDHEQSPEGGVKQLEKWAIRKILHPELNIEDIQPEKLWVPGNYHEELQKRTISVPVVEENEHSKRVIKSRQNSRPFTNYQKYLQMKVNTPSNENTAKSVKSFNSKAFF